MPSATRPTRLEPVTPQNAVLLLVDQQEGLFSRIHEPEQTRRNLLALARSAQLFGDTGGHDHRPGGRAQLPALASAAEGYDSYVVVDASGRFEPVPSVATISRLTQAGVALVTTRVIVLETMADNAHPRAEEIYATLPAGLVIMDDAGQ